MVDHLVDSVANVVRAIGSNKEHHKGPYPVHPRSDLMNHVNGHVQKPGFKEGERERYNAFIEDVLRELGWCTRHSPWGFYYRRNRTVGCKGCDDDPTSVMLGRERPGRRWWGGKAS